MYRGINIRLIMDFSFKSMASRGKWNDIFKVLNEKKKSI